MIFRHRSSSLLLGLIILCSLRLGHESIIVGGLIRKLRGHKELQASWQTVKECCITWNREVRIQGGHKHYNHRKVFPTFSNNICNVQFNSSDRARICRKSIWLSETVISSQQRHSIGSINKVETHKVQCIITYLLQKKYREMPLSS